MPTLLDEAQEITISKALLDEIKQRIIDLITDERKRRSFFRTIGRCLRALKCKLICCFGNSKCIVGEPDDAPSEPTIHLQREPDVVNGPGPRRLRASTRLDI